MEPLLGMSGVSRGDRGLHVCNMWGRGCWCTQIGGSLFDEEGAGIVSELVDKAKAKGVQLHFPVDFITGDKFSKDANVSSAL